MPTDLALRRTLTVRAHDGRGLRKLVLVKKRGESIEHVLMKAVLWALYLPDYPGVQVEVPIGDTYKPDLVALAPPRGGLAYGDPEPVFWAEAGKVSRQKWASLLKRFPDTHFALARWNERLGPHEAVVRKALGTRPRRAPFDILSLPPDAAERFLADDGTLTVSHADLGHTRLGGSGFS
ncbi:MAG: hypothetical protein AAF845_17500 [Bacteroidota bacterium]